MSKSWVVFALGACVFGCTPGYIKSSELEKNGQGPSACAKSCEDLGMRMTAMVLVGDTVPGCVCQPVTIAPASAEAPAPPSPGGPNPGGPNPGGPNPGGPNPGGPNPGGPVSGVNPEQGAAASSGGYVLIAAAAAAREQQEQLRRMQQQQKH